MALTYTCECGFTVSGNDEDDFVVNATAHAKGEHSVDITREQALALISLED